MKVLDSLTAVINVFTIILIYVENYIFWSNSNELTSICNYLRGIAMLSSGAVVICIVIHYNYKLNVIKYRDNRVEENVTLWSTGLYKYLFIEVAINCFVCPPTIDATYYMKSVGKDLEYSFDCIT